MLACVLDRASGKAYKPAWYANAAPTLTTSSQYLFLLVAGEVKMAAEACALFRFLSMPERQRDQKRLLFRNLRCVIIDEISMVSADMMYNLDARLREITMVDTVFGGLSETKIDHNK